MADLVGWVAWLVLLAASAGLVVENSTQRGNNAAAYLDGVAAVTRRLAYLMLSAGSWDDLCTIVQRCPVGSKKAYDVALGQLQKGNGLGRDVIIAFHTL